MKGTKSTKYLYLCIEHEKLQGIYGYIINNHSFTFTIEQREPYIHDRDQNPDCYFFILAHDYEFIKSIIL